MAIYLIVTLISLPLIWRYTPFGKQWLKYMLYAMICLFITFPIPFWFFRPRDSRNALLPSRILRALSRIFLGFEATVEGEEHIVRNSGSVVLLNHQSVLDLIVLAYLLPVLPRLTVTCKKEIIFYPPVGLGAWLCGTIFIDRKNSSGAKKALNETGEIINQRKARVLIFPEGTRNGGSKLLPFKKGAFHLAIASQCPIQPVAVSRFTFLGRNKFENGKVRIRILPAISTENCTTEDVPRLMNETYETISRNVDQLSVT